MTGKCLDNRVAAWVVLEAMKKAKSPNYEVILACTVQEEVGLRGAGAGGLRHAAGPGDRAGHDAVRGHARRAGGRAGDAAGRRAWP